MNRDDIDRLSIDTSSTALFAFELHTMNGSLTADQRRAVAEIVRRVSTGLNLQLGMLLGEGSYELKLRHVSSRHGTTEIDVGDG